MTNKKIVIINTVPVNGGDEALLVATTNGLRNNFDNPSIHVLCNDPITCKKAIKNEVLDWDWEYAFKRADNNENTLFFKLKLKIRNLLKRVFGVTYNHFFSILFASKREKRVFKILNEADFILLGAGGYIHDFYGYSKRLETLSFIRNVLKKPYYFFSQSIGPFWKENQYAHLKEALNGAKKIILREHYSLNHLKGIGYHCNNVVVSNDVAFYLFFDYAKKIDLTKRLKKIAINFRKWEFEKESRGNLTKAKLLCENLISKGYELTFLSTCQGVIGYKDDSDFAEEIVNLLSDKYKTKCTILKKKYSINEFLDILSSQDAYIGMRLHGAILSLLAGIPALAIAYEDKTPGIYESLNLLDYCFSYKEEQEVWNDKVDMFIKNYSNYLDKIEDVTKEAAISVQNNFKLLLH